MSTGKRNFVSGITFVYILFSYLFTIGLCIYEGGKKYGLVVLFRCRFINRLI